MLTGKKIEEIKINEITTNPLQARAKFDNKALQELAQSIKQHGIIQPLILRKIPTGYELIAGQRRLKAAELVGLAQVPAIILEIDDKTSAELALVENLQRQNLTPIEEAKQYKNLIENPNNNDQELSKAIAKEQNVINNKMKLLNLSNEVQNALQNSEISEGHAKVLLQLENKERQTELLDKIIKERLTVKQLDEIVKMEINPNMQKALNGIDLVDKKSNTFNDIEPEIVEDKMDQTQIINIDEIKKAAKDVNPITPTADINNLLKVEKPKINEQKEKTRFSFAGKFFPSLEDEQANMDLEGPSTSLAKNVETPYQSIEPLSEIKIDKIETPDYESIQGTPTIINNNDNQDITKETTSELQFTNDEVPAVPFSNNQNEITNSILPETTLQNNINADYMNSNQMIIDNNKDYLNNNIGNDTPITPLTEEIISNENSDNYPSFDINNIPQVDQFQPKEPITSNETINIEMPQINVNNFENNIPIVQNEDNIQPIIEEKVQDQNNVPLQEEVNQVNMKGDITKEIPEIQNNVVSEPVFENSISPINEQNQLNQNIEISAPNNENSNNQEPQFLPEFKEDITETKEQITKTNPYYLKNALNMSRQLINNLETAGYIVDFEETDLVDEYQIVIKIKKENI